MPNPIAAVAASTVAGAASSRSAARAQTNAANQASATELQMFEQNRQDQAPWRNAGVSALSQLLSDLGLEDNTQAAQPTGQQYPGYAGGYFDQDSMQWVPAQAQQPAATAPARREGYGQLLRNFTMADYEQDPGYQFRLAEGERAINRNALAQGRYRSGGTLRELQRYNSGLASQEYGAAYDRFNNNQTNRFNRLASIAGVGQQATNALNSDRSALSGRLGENALAAGNARAAGAVGTANALNQGVSTGINFWQQQQLLDMIKAGKF